MAGALLSALCMWLTDPVVALVITMLAPLLLLWAAEMFGFVHFVRLERETDDSILGRIHEDEMTQDEAVDKYGYAIVNEMDVRIGHAEAMVTEMKRHRNELANKIQEKV
jgi:hypothetical protein